MRTFVIQLSVLLITAVHAISAERLADTNAVPFLPQTTNGNFVLYVSNQSFAMPLVDIMIQIDGMHAVSNSFHVTGDRIPQHNTFRFVFALSPGKHTISAASSTAGVTIQKEIDIKQRHWAAVDFAFDPKRDKKKHIHFNMWDKPIGLL